MPDDGRNEDGNVLPSKKKESHPQIIAAVVAALMSLIVAFVTTLATDFNAEQEFMRTERSRVYGEYLQATLVYQNALTGYTYIIPVVPGVDRVDIDPALAGPAYEKIKTARENYLNTKTRARLLQDPSAQDLQDDIDDELTKTHEELEKNAVLNLERRSTEAVTNQKMRDLAGSDFDVRLTILRNHYVDEVRNDFESESWFSRLLQWLGG